MVQIAEHLGYRRLSKDFRAYPVQGCPGLVPHPCTGWPWTLSVKHGYHIGMLCNILWSVEHGKAHLNYRNVCIIINTNVCT
jgi:hypothetical protein